MSSPFPDRSVLRATWILVGVSLLVRILFVQLVFEDRFYFSDERNYYREADRVVAGEWLGTNTRYPPGPVYFLAACRAAGLELEGIRIVQAALGAAATGLTVLLGALLFGSAAGILAGIAVALYPYLAYISGVLYTQNQVIPLLLLILLCLYRRQLGGGRRWIVAGGAALGIAGNFVVPIFLTAPALAIWHGLRVRPLRRGAVDVLLLTVLTCLMLVPVTLRNFATADRFIFVSDMGASSLYAANNPEVSPNERDVEAWIRRNTVEVREEQERMGWTDAQVDSALSARAWEHIRGNPGRFLRAYAARAANMWSFRPNPWTRNEHTGGLQFLVASLTSGPALILALLGAVLFLPRWRRLLPLYAIPLILTLGFSMFVTTVRYRLLFEPLLLILAAALLVRLFARGRLGGVVTGEPSAEAPSAPAAARVPPVYLPHHRKRPEE